MRLLVILEPLIALLVLWAIINVAHAILTSPEEKVSSWFWSISNAIKREKKK